MARPYYSQRKWWFSRKSTCNKLDVAFQGTLLNPFSLQSFNALRGGFSVINQRWVLTAAHLFDGVIPKVRKALLYVVGEYVSYML